MGSSSKQEPGVIPPPTVRFGYFVVQARPQVDGDHTQVEGVLENLSTGEKQAFGSTDEMVRLVGKWVGLPPSES